MSEPLIHDGPTSLATYLAACDVGSRWAADFVHLCRGDSAFTLCGLPALANTHGSLGIMCPDCRSLRGEAVIASFILEREGR